MYEGKKIEELFEEINKLSVIISRLREDVLELSDKVDTVIGKVGETNA